MKKKIRKTRPPIWPYILTGCVFLAIAGCVFYILYYCHVKAVMVEGNIHYTNDEISAMVMDGFLGDNTVYLYLKYRNREIKDVPFIETMSVSIESRDTIRIIVYEKSLAGYVEYMDNYLYFDRTGTVVESSSVLTTGIPKVTGLNFGYAVLYEPLPVEDPEVFERVLDTTQLLNKYELDADRIHFALDDSLVLYFGDIKVFVGEDTFIDEKIMVLPDILSNLEGQSGTIDLADYKSGDTITFEKSD